MPTILPTVMKERRSSGACTLWVCTVRYFVFVVICGRTHRTSSTGSVADGVIGYGQAMRHRVPPSTPGLQRPTGCNAFCPQPSVHARPTRALPDAAQPPSKLRVRTFYILSKAYANIKGYRSSSYLSKARLRPFRYLAFLACKSVSLERLTLTSNKVRFAHARRPCVSSCAHKVMLSL